MTGWRGSAVWVPLGEDRETLGLHPIALLRGLPVGDIVMQMLGDPIFDDGRGDLRAGDLAAAFSTPESRLTADDVEAQSVVTYQGIGRGAWWCRCLADGCAGHTDPPAWSPLSVTSAAVRGEIAQAQRDDERRDAVGPWWWLRRWQYELRRRDAARRAQRNTEVDDAA